jgi:acetyl-CoA carboxylase carboxyltransferase component
VAAGQLLLVVQPDNEPTAEREAPRLALPHSEDPLDELYDEENRPQNGALISDDRLQRDRARSATLAALRRILLGYDTAPDRDDTLHEIFERTLPPELSSEVLTELADFRRAVVMFADTEILFSRLPGEPDEGTPSRSNDAWLTLYLRRIEAAGAGIDESFRDQLCRALEHFGITGLSPSEALDRALLRLYATRTRRELRHRIAESILRLLGRLANAGVNLGEDEPLARALGICLELRGEVPDSLSDAAAEARYTIFELPQIERRTAAATAIVEEALQTIASGNASGVDLETLVRIADSAPALFDRIAAWATDASATRVQVALQALVLRQFAATVPRRCTPLPSIHETAVEVEFEDGITVLAAFAKLGSVDEVWEALCNSGRGPRAPLIEVTVLADGAIEEDALRAEVSPLVARAPAETRRVCFSTLPTSKNPLTLAYSGGAEGRCEQTDLMGLHPETARRLDLDRLVEFDVERLPAPRSIYAFHGKSSVVPDDAALPGRMGTLHEAAFAQTFAEAARTLRRLRNEHEIWQRLHWNRLFLVVRPAFYLLPATLDRLARELLPATRHLGLQKIIVRLALRDQPQDTSGPERELVIEPSPDGPEHIDWRDPHRGPIPPADANARRLAEARRRGLIYPYDAIRLFTQGEHAAASFEEYDLDARTGGAVSVGDRAPGGNRAAVVFGVITTPTDKHPEGVKRVCILSDPTREMGALAAPECDRLIAALDLAEKLRVPAEWVANSAGARISMDSGTENLDAVAGVVRRIVHFTEQGGEINIIVSGVNVGAQSYFDALSTMLMHTRGILIMTNSGSMVLTGRNALEASGSISAEDELGIGGFERIMGPNGQAQYYGRDLAEAYEILMRHYTYTFVAPGESQPRPFATTDPAGRAISQAPYEPSEDDFASIGAILSDQTNPGRKRPFAIRPLMRALVDRDGGWLERWTNMAGAENAVVWDAHLGGHPICLIGIENRPLPRAGHPPLDGPDQWTGATLFPFSSKKVARAINAASANRSVVLLANLAGFDGSPESMRKLQLEYGAEIARAVVNFQGRFLFVVVSRYHGGAYVVFSRHLNEGIHAVALSGSYASVIGGGPAASVIFSAEVRRRTSADPRLAALEEQLQRAGETLRRDQLRIQLESLRTQVSTEKHAEVAAEFDRVHSVERARQVGSLHDIVSTDDLRRHLIEHL